jgi:hypothetical protein
MLPILHMKKLPLSSGLNVQGEETIAYRTTATPKMEAYIPLKCYICLQDYSTNATIRNAII